MSLIRKGGFRERANRNYKYKDSENQQASLMNQNQYQPKSSMTSIEPPAPIAHAETPIACHDPKHPTTSSDE